jgi:hypothetical protein
MDENRNNAHDWIEDDLRALAVPPGWEPDPMRAMERLRGRPMPRSRPGVWSWLAVATAGVALVILLLPPVSNVAAYIAEGQEDDATDRIHGLTAFAAAEAAAVFEGETTLLRPASYREWVFVGSSLGLSYAETAVPDTSAGRELFHNVYIDPAAYQAFSETGTFPDGTVMILELMTAEVKNEPGLQGRYEGEFVALEASVKDSSRFEGDWAYYGFTERGGRLKDKAEPFDRETCWECHNQNAATDMVFTQFYPVLQAAAARSIY